MKIIKKTSHKPATRQRPSNTRPTGIATSFSYHSRRSDSSYNTGRQTPAETEKVERKTPAKNFWQRIATFVFIVVLIVCLYGVLALSSNPKIVVLNTGTAATYLQPASVYQTAASTLLQRSYWDHNKLTIDTASINHALVTRFPELLSTSVTIPLLSSQPVIYIQPSIPSAVVQAQGATYLLDSRGVVLQAVVDISSSERQHLPIVTYPSATRFHAGSQVLTSSDISFIQTVVYELAARHLTVSHFDLPAGTSELDAYINGEPYYVKFNLENTDALQQVGTFLAAKTYLEGQHIVPTKYVDARVDGRVYYL